MTTYDENDTSLVLIKALFLLLIFKLDCWYE
jgi:hypothetical protein